MSEREDGGGARAIWREVVSHYDRLEPGDGDRWNPLLDEAELAMRLRLLAHVAQALRATGRDARSLRVLDVGCGNGRSTRAYLDLGLRPAQLTGIDLRPGAIAHARALHPSIRYLVDPGDGSALGDERFDFISASLAFSSIEPAGRPLLAASLARRLAPPGHLFYFDRVRANRFAGWDRIAPRALFADLEPIPLRPSPRIDVRLEPPEPLVERVVRRAISTGRARLFGRSEAHLFRTRI